MALILTATEEKKFIIEGTNFEFESIYVRINWNAPMHGLSAQYSLIPFQNKSFYKLNKPCPITFDGGSGFVIIENGSSQDLLTIHQLVKVELESKGFNVTIDLA
jgi:hypothetical protein